MIGMTKERAQEIINREGVDGLLRKWLNAEAMGAYGELFVDDPADHEASKADDLIGDLARACLDTLTALESAQADLKNRDNQIVDAERLATERLSDIVRLEAENAALREDAERKDRAIEAWREGLTNLHNEAKDLRAKLARAEAAVVE